MTLTLILSLRSVWRFAAGCFTPRLQAEFFPQLFAFSLARCPPLPQLQGGLCLYSAPHQPSAFKAKRGVKQ